MPGCRSPAGFPERLDSAVLAALTAPEPKPGLHTPVARTGIDGLRLPGQRPRSTSLPTPTWCGDAARSACRPPAWFGLMAREDSTDLALLRTLEKVDRAIARFRQGRGIRPGASVLGDRLSASGDYSPRRQAVCTGTVSAPRRARRRPPPVPDHRPGATRKQRWPGAGRRRQRSRRGRLETRRHPGRTGYRRYPSERELRHRRRRRESVPGRRGASLTRRRPSPKGT